MSEFFEKVKKETKMKLFLVTKEQIDRIEKHIHNLNPFCLEQWHFTSFLLRILANYITEMWATTALAKKIEAVVHVLPLMYRVQQMKVTDYKMKLQAVVPNQTKRQREM